MENSGVTSHIDMSTERLDAQIEASGSHESQHLGKKVLPVNNVCTSETEVDDNGKFYNSSSRNKEYESTYGGNEDYSEDDEDNDEDEDEDIDDTYHPIFHTYQPTVRRCGEQAARFIIEELVDDEASQPNELEVLLPDQYEEAKSGEENSFFTPLGKGANILLELRNLTFNGETERSNGNTDINIKRMSEARRDRYRRKKQRWSARLFKRSHSKSIGSDTDTDDADAWDGHNVGMSARRLRRRIRGPDQNSDDCDLCYSDYNNRCSTRVEGLQSNICLGATTVTDDGETTFIIHGRASPLVESPPQTKPQAQLQTSTNDDRVEFSNFEVLPFWRLDSPIETG